jgi:dihydrofolate synthase/folylpolyglutamate synthase
LLGEHQLINATVVVATMEKLRQRGINIPEVSVHEGLRQVRWPGRLEILGRNPLVVVDCAHNADSAAKLKASIKKLFAYRHLVLIFGASSDKDIEGMMRELFPLADQVIVTQARHPRAMDSAALKEKALLLGREVRASDSVAGALSLALETADPQDLICATGSIFVVAEVQEAWAEKQGAEIPERD